MAIVINGSGTVTGITGDLTLDAGGDIVIDADGGDIKFKDAGTHIGSISNLSSDLLIESKVSDKDIVFKGNDGGSDVTAMTIDMSAGGNVGIGTNAPARTLHVNSADANIASFEGHQGEGLVISSVTNGQVDVIGYDDGASAYNDLVLRADSNGLTLKTDGRGLSQFTAKAWVSFNGTGTVAIRDSHNVSSITDHATGDYSINFTNNMANVNYSAVGGASHNSDNNGYVQCMGIKTFAVGSARMITAYIPETGGSHYDSYWATLTVFGD
mgnify:CR=1 FL=1